MATLRQRLHRKNATGTYDVIHLETESGLVLRSDGTTVEQAITDLTPTVGESVPKTLKCGALYVNSADSSFYLGNAADMPVKLITVMNVEDYIPEGGGSSEPTVPPDLPDKSNLVLGNSFTWGLFKWLVVHVDEDAQECYLALHPDSRTDGSRQSKFSEIAIYFQTWMSLYITEGQQAAMKYISAGSAPGRIFAPTEEMVTSTFDYYRASTSNRTFGADWWTSTSGGSSATFVSSSGEIFAANTTDHKNFRAHCCIDMSLYDSGDSGGGSEVNPELPDKDSLTIGNTVMFADREWVVSHKTADSCYLTLSDSPGKCTWNMLQNACTNFADQLNEDQKACLKSITADSTSGKVFVATYKQMNGGFSYFNSNSHRSINEVYWTSTEFIVSGVSAYYVDRQGYLSHSGDYFVSSSLGFRPSVCIDLTLYV